MLKTVDELKIELENANSLQKCKDIMNPIVNNFLHFVNDPYSSYSHTSLLYKSIIFSNINTKWIKSIMHALLKQNITPDNYLLKHLIDDLIKIKDFKKVKILVRIFDIKELDIPDNTCLETSKDPLNNKWIMIFLTKYQTSLNTKKAFLAGAIETRNIELIMFIIDVLKINLFVTTRSTQFTCISKSLAKTDDLELLQLLENHGYNMHEARRKLLKEAYDRNSDRITKYVLQKQEQTEIPHLYMESIGNTAFHKNDEAMLTKYPYITFNPSIKRIYRALINHNSLIKIKVLLARFISIKKKQLGLNPASENQFISIFTINHLNRFKKLATYDNIWNYISEILYKYGISDVKTKLLDMGYIPNIETQFVSTLVSNNENNNNILNSVDNGNNDSIMESVEDDENDENEENDDENDDENEENDKNDDENDDEK